LGIFNPQSANVPASHFAMTDPADAPIFLIGYRGTGKTSAARELAARLGWQAFDVDDEIERRAGRSIAAIFAEEGEAAFRDIEAQVVAGLTRRRQVVVSVGGGTLGREENRRTICAAGRAIWLTASVDTILQRLARDPATASRRPNLTAEGGRAEVAELLAARSPAYRECATLTIDTEGKTVESVVGEIAERLRREGWVSAGPVS
jgi:shikimate kinase